MAWIETKSRTDGGSSYIVRWRLGGTRGGKPQHETFSKASDERNLAQAEGFKRMVTAAGEEWPEGWVRGKGFIRDRSTVAPSAGLSSRSVEEVGSEYVDQLVDCSPGQRKRYHAQLRLLKDLDIQGTSGPYRPFDAAINKVTEDDVKAWLIGWKRSLKTKANYHGLLFGVFSYALERHEVNEHPLIRTAPKRNKIKQSQADLRFLTEQEFASVAKAAKDDGDLLKVTAGTGMRYGEVTALWVSDVDLKHKTIRVNKAWKRDGDNGDQDVPAWLKKQLTAKHAMRGHHLGNPKTPKSKRTIVISDEAVKILTRLVKGKLPDDFVFVSPTGLPLHNGDYYERVWLPLMGSIRKLGVAPFRFHDLRHTHVAWLIAGGVPLPHIQGRLGHESITTTIDTYGHLLPVGDDLIAAVTDTALRGEEIHPRPALRLVEGGKADAG
jgi:integrase